MAMHRGKYLVLFAALFALIGLAAQSIAYVPDFVAVSEQPETIDADGNSTTNITVQLMADLGGEKVDIVKKCGVEIICESQDPDVLNNGTGGSTLSDFTDAFGKVTFLFKSTGSEKYNEGNVEVICRSLQLKEGSSYVRVETGAADHFHITQCPKSGYDNLNQATKDSLAQDPNFVVDDAQADILADGKSHVYITAQLKNERDNPVHKVGKIRFKSIDTVIVKSCGPKNASEGINAFGYNQTILDTGQVLVTSDTFGVATAEFCSAGSGQENIGVAEIHIESVDFPNVVMNTTYVKTTSEFGTTYKNGYLAMASMADQIMADNVSCVNICVQARDQDYRIIRKANWTVMLESEDTSRLKAKFPGSPTDDGLNFTNTNSEGIAIAKYCSAGKIDPNNVGIAEVRGSAPTLVQEASIYVDLRTEQIWPVDLEVKATMPQVDCDGESTVTVTAQLLDRYGLATKFLNRTVTFKSDDISKLKNPKTGGSTIDAYTDAFGKAHATFNTTDCKFGGVDGTATITVTTQSPSISGTATVQVIKPLGFVPDAVSVYSDQGLLGFDADHPAHAKPFLIAADGMKPTYVTAQICEWVYDVQGAPLYCNPVKRDGVEVEFEVLDNNVVQNKGNDNPNPSGENGVDYVKFYTDDEGQATAIFRSTGDGTVNKDKCTLIKVTAKNGEPLGNAYAEVCAKGMEGTNANSIWIWADPAIISADGTSHTVIRSALYFCEGTLPDARTLNQSSNYNFLNESCKPAQQEGVTVKFETMNTDALDDRFGGYKIYNITNQFGQSQGTFQSKGSDTQHITGAPGAEIQAWTIGSGENIIQLNELRIRTEEKTWPWCQPHPDWDPEVVYADSDGDKFITDSELIEFIVKVWMPIQIVQMTCPPYKLDCPIGYDIDDDLIDVIRAWLNQQ